MCEFKIDLSPDFGNGSEFDESKPAAKRWQVEIAGCSWRDEWDDVLDIGALCEDIASENTVRRMAARRGKEAVTDFLVCRMAFTHPFAVRLRLAPQLREI